MFDVLVPPESSPNIPHAYQTYLMLSRSLSKDTPNYIKSYAATLAYKSVQHVITDDYGWMIVEHLLIRCDTHLGGKANDLQKKMYEQNVIPG